MRSKKILLTMGILASVLLSSVGQAASESISLWTFTGSKEDGGMRRLPDSGTKAKVDKGRNVLLVTGGDKDSYISLIKDFSSAPQPTMAKISFKRVAPQESGAVALTLNDVVSGEGITVCSFANGEIGWNFSTNGNWGDWKGYQKTSTGPEAPTEIGIEMLSSNKFRILAQGNQIGPIIDLPTLRHVQRIGLRINPGTKGVEILGGSAAAVPGNISSLPSLRVVDLKLPAGSDNKTFTPTNPAASCYQLPFFERGFSDAVHDPVLMKEFIAAVNDLGVKTFRYPGGTWTYGYFGDNMKAYAALVRSERLAKEFYFARDPWKFQFVNDEQFFDVCKQSKIDAIYELNLGLWYDEKNDRMVSIAPFDRADFEKDKNFPVYEPSLLDAALDAAKARVRQARKAGVKVTWEMGNEDYCYFLPETYAKQCAAFYHAIREEDPTAEFIFCTDGYSWSDWSWPGKVMMEFKRLGITDMAAAGTHIYFSGGGGGSRDNGNAAYEGIRFAWNTLRNLNAGTHIQLRNAGMDKTKVSLTESNTSFSSEITGRAVEHSMGRALGEAAMWVELIKTYYHVVHHDLIRSGYGSGTWFERLYYLTGAPVGHRYALSLDGKVMSVMHRHAERQILLGDSLLTISRGESDVLVSQGNPYNVPLKSRIQLPRGWRADDKAQPMVRMLVAPELDSSDITEIFIKPELQFESGRQILVFEAPPMSFCSVLVPLQGSDTKN